MKHIYLDHTATTPLDPRVFEAMRPFYTESFGNASSVHWYGRQANAAIEGAREAIARCIGADAPEVVFTSGGTEADNLAVRGAATAARARGKTHLVTSRAEHHAVLDTCKALVEEGFDVTFLAPDSTGMVGLEELRESLATSTCLVSIMHANNEVGTINPIRDITDLAHRRGVLVHTDAVQTVGKIPVDVRQLGVDLLTLSGHKVYGPKGVGALYVRTGVEIRPLLCGGGQEGGKRPGTVNVALAVGLATAVELALQEMEEESRRLGALRDTLEERLRLAFSEVVVNGHPRERLPHILSVSFDSSQRALQGEMLVPGLDLEGIAVSSGSACTSGSVQPSHVLRAMGRDPATAKATIRFSFGRANTVKDIESVVDALRAAVERAKV